jgi:hypothetical protein
MMTQEMRKAAPKTLKAAKEANYTIFFSDYSKVSSDMLTFIANDFLGSDDYLKVVKQMESPAFFRRMFENFNNSINKYAFIGWKSFMTPFSSKIICTTGLSFYDSVSSEACNAFATAVLEKWESIVRMIKPYAGHMPLILKENYITVAIGFEFDDRSNPFLHTGNEILGRLINGGILQYLKKLEDIQKIEVDAAGPKMLLIDDLSFGFILWLGACGISTVVFILEIVSLALKFLGLSIEQHLAFYVILQALLARLKFFH